MVERKAGNRKTKQTRPETNQAEATDTQTAPETAPETAQDEAPAVTEAPRTVEDDRPADEQLLRLRADFENYKRRVLREKDSLYSRANEDLMTALLPVLDHLDIAFNAVSERAEDPVVKGFRLVADQLLDVLGKFGLTPIDAQGGEFDPNWHEAISHMVSPDMAENQVLVQTRRGYRLGDRLLRAAQVVVSRGAPEPGAAETESADGS